MWLLGSGSAGLGGVDHHVGSGGEPAGPVGVDLDAACLLDDEQGVVAVREPGRGGVGPDVVRGVGDGPGDTTAGGEQRGEGRGSGGGGDGGQGQVPFLRSGRSGSVLSGWLMWSCGGCLRRPGPRGEGAAPGRAGQYSTRKSSGSNVTVSVLSSSGSAHDAWSVKVSSAIVRRRSTSRVLPSARVTFAAVSSQ